MSDAVAEDWPGIWRIMQPIAAAGETFSWDRDISEERARAMWLHQPPGRCFVAVEDQTIVGTAETHRNQGAPGSHVANAGFMVDPGNLPPRR